MTDNPTTPQSYAPGWYPDVNAPGTDRYYDGTQWTAQSRPTAGVGQTSAPVAVAEAPAEAKPKKKLKWWQWALIGFGALILFIIIVGSINGGGDDDPTPVGQSQVDEEEPAAEEEVPAPVEVTVPETTGMTAKEAEALLDNEGLVTEFSAEEGIVLDRDNWTVLSTTPAAGQTATEGDTVVVNVEKILTPEEQAAKAQEEKLAAMTVAQRNAVGDAQSYLDYSGFSRSGLIGQLEYEGYSTADATFAADNAGANWNNEAAESAKSYMDYSSFSRQGLYDQLAYEGFTHEQIEAGLKAVGY